MVEELPTLRRDGEREGERGRRERGGERGDGELIHKDVNTPWERHVQCMHTVEPQKTLKHNIDNRVDTHTLCIYIHTCTCHVYKQPVSVHYIP